MEINTENLHNTLKDQMTYKSQTKNLPREINNEYMKGYNEKMNKQIQKEQEQEQALKIRKKEVQDYNFKQIEDKKARKKGMSLEEFQYNKDLLTEIVTKKKDLRESVINMSQANH